MARTEPFQAFTAPLWEHYNVIHTLLGKNPKSASKITNLAWSTISFAQNVTEYTPAFSEFKVTCDLLKCFGKLVDTDGMIYGFTTSDSKYSLRQPNENDPGLNGLNNNTGINNFVYIAKISSVALATLIQTFQTCQKYVHPEFFTKVGEAVAVNVRKPFVMYTAKIAMNIGGERLAAIVQVATTASVSNIKNVSLIIFLAIDGYQCVQRVRQIAISNDKNAELWKVYHEIKTVENLGKIACVSLCMMGASPILIAAIGLGVAYTSVVTEYQKATIRK